MVNGRPKYRRLDEAIRLAWQGVSVDRIVEQLECTLATADYARYEAWRLRRIAGTILAEPRLLRSQIAERYGVSTRTMTRLLAVLRGLPLRVTATARLVPRQRSAGYGWRYELEYDGALEERP